MRFLESIPQKARDHRQTIVLAEGEDPRVIAAAQRAQDDGIASCVLIGKAAIIRQKADASEFSLSDIRIEDPCNSQYHQRYSKDLWQLRKHKGMTLEQASRRALDPLCFADLMLRANDVDGSIAGAVYTTGGNSIFRTNKMPAPVIPPLPFSKFRADKNFSQPKFFLGLFTKPITL